MSICPLVAGFSPVLFSALFFALILLLCIRQSAVVDIVGKILTPGLLIGLLGSTLCISRSLRADGKNTLPICIGITIGCIAVQAAIMFLVVALVY